MKNQHCMLCGTPLTEANDSQAPESTGRAVQMPNRWTSAVTDKLDALQNGCIDLYFRQSGHNMSTVPGTIRPVLIVSAGLSG